MAQGKIYWNHRKVIYSLYRGKFAIFKHLQLNFRLMKKIGDNNIFLTAQEGKKLRYFNDLRFKTNLLIFFKTKQEFPIILFYFQWETTHRHPSRVSDFQQIYDEEQMKEKTDIKHIKSLLGLLKHMTQWLILNSIPNPILEIGRTLCRIFRYSYFFLLCI